jgi:hypothetical protein
MKNNVDSSTIKSFVVSKSAPNERTQANMILIVSVIFIFREASHCEL